MESILTDAYNERTKPIKSAVAKNTLHNTFLVKCVIFYYPIKTELT